jgi:hypothetical protein
MSRIPALALETATLAAASQSPALLSGRITRPAINTHQGKSMKVRYWINGAVVALSMMIGSTSSAPVSTMTGLARSDTLPVTKVAERQHHSSRVHNSRLGFHGWHSSFGAAVDDPPAPRSDWYPHDSTQLPFGSARWWNQIQLETGHGGR